MPEKKIRGEKSNEDENNHEQPQKVGGNGLGEENYDQDLNKHERTKELQRES